MNTFEVSKLDHNDVLDEAAFSTVNDVIAFMQKQIPNSSMATVVLQYPRNATVAQLRTFREKCRTVGFLDVRLVSCVSLSLSLLLMSLQTPIDNGTLVAVLNAKMYYIVTRDGRSFKIQKGGPLDQFDVEHCDVSKVVVSNAFGRFDKATLEAVQQKFRSNLLVVTDISKLDSLRLPFLWSCVDETAEYTYAFNDFCDYDIDIKGHKLFSTRFKEFPIAVTTDVAVSKTAWLVVNLIKSETAVEHLKRYALNLSTRLVRIGILANSSCDITLTVKVFSNAEARATFVSSGRMVAAEKSAAVKVEPVVATKKTASDRKKVAQLNADVHTQREDEIDNAGSVSTLAKGLSKLQTDPPPATILKFTSDNRVLIEADESYTGEKQLLAYVRLQGGKAPIVGKDAFDALRTSPDSVFYDIIRLLADDFDPDYPHPSWRFKATRGTDGKLLIHGGNNIFTLPIVLFGLVVNSTLLYIRGHLAAVIHTVGIRLPWGSSINENDLKCVSEKIGVKLVILEYK
uniref:Non-specific protein-tyrosine kinase n=1 Tax=Panagrellus redivivus TaxID=6233 RepID=A0A7E4V6D1_PANRE